MVSGNEIIFSDKTQDKFNNFWAACDKPPLLNDGKRIFFVSEGFVVYYSPPI